MVVTLSPKKEENVLELTTFSSLLLLVAQQLVKNKNSDINNRNGSHGISNVLRDIHLHQFLVLHLVFLICCLQLIEFRHQWLSLQ